MLWDVFCRVIDNFGDVGVCWRLAADLAGRGEAVRLWLDDASALQWLAPRGHAGVSVLGWHDAVASAGDVVVEAFGCDPPAGFVERIAAARPVWINLEYLSAERYVERSHALASPVMQGPARGLTKWFYYPGFTDATGGLLREPGLDEARAAFDREHWLGSLGLRCEPGERIVSLFCYASAPVEALLAALAAQPTLLLATAGPAAQAVASALGPTMRRGALRAASLPLLPQTGFDRLLWAADLNLVRGEDSFVRAQWAGRPFVWQAYAQDDGAHVAKLDAFLERLLGVADDDRRRDPAFADFAASMRAIWRAWNGLGPWPQRLPASLDWLALVERWRASQAARPDLVTQLQSFVAGKR